MGEKCDKCGMSVGECKVRLFGKKFCDGVCAELDLQEHIKGIWQGLERAKMDPKEVLTMAVANAESWSNK